MVLNFSYCVICYILVLIYLLTVSLYLWLLYLTPLPSPSAPGNPDLFFPYLVLGAQHHDFIFLYTFKMITTISLATTCHHTKVLHNYWLYSTCYIFHTCDWFCFITVYLLIFLTCFSDPPASNHLLVLFICLFVFICSVF